jgi:hypothetical protein
MFYFSKFMIQEEIDELLDGQVLGLCFFLRTLIEATFHFYQKRSILVWSWLL